MLKWIGVGILGLLVIAQLVPYGRAHDNPAVTGEPKWDSARTAELVAGACDDCHSNLTDWKWYSNAAPASWLVQRDVDEGRVKLNFSEWDRFQEEAGEAAETVEEGEMPPWQYKLLHSSARLSDSEKQDLANGLRRTLAADPPGP